MITSTIAPAAAGERHAAIPMRIQLGDSTEPRGRDEVAKLAKSNGARRRPGDAGSSRQVGDLKTGGADALSANLPEVDLAEFAKSSAPDLARLARLRAAAEAAIEQLLALLDDLDGDPDLEPSLGSLENHPSDHRVPNFWGELVGHFTGTTREGSQLCWSEEADGGDDAEDEHDGCEDGGDDEPSLGSIPPSPGRVFVDGNAMWPDQVAVIDGGFDQEHWALGSSDDCEGEHDGREAAGKIRPMGGFADRGRRHRAG